MFRFKSPFMWHTSSRNLVHLPLCRHACAIIKIIYANSNQISFVHCAAILLPVLYHACIDNYSGAIDIIRILSRERGPTWRAYRDDVPKHRPWVIYVRQSKANLKLKRTDSRTFRAAATCEKLCWQFSIWKLPSELMDGFRKACMNFFFFSQIAAIKKGEGGHSLGLVKYIKTLKLVLSWAQRWVRRRLNCWSKHPQVSLRNWQRHR